MKSYRYYLSARPGPPSYLLILLATFLSLGAPLWARPVADAALPVRGKVTDSNNQPLAGVSIVIKGSTQGTPSDVAGRYTLNVPDAKAVLVFRFIGYKSQEVVVSNSETSNVTLTENNQSLYEVIVTGVFDKRTRMESSVAISTPNTGGFPAALNRQGFTKDFVAVNPNAVLATQGSMPRAYFLTASYKF